MAYYLLGDILKFVCTVCISIWFPAMWKSFAIWLLGKNTEPTSRFWDIPNIVSFIVLLPLLYSLIRQAVIYSPQLRARFLRGEEKVSVSSRVLWICKTPEFWVKASVFALIFIFLGLDKSHLAPQTDYSGWTDLWLFFVCAFAVDALAYYSAATFWIEDRKKPPENNISAYLKGLFNVVFVYLPAGLFFNFCAPTVMSIVPAIPQLFTLGFTIVFIVLVLFPPAYRALRVVKQRKRLFTELDWICKKRGFSYTSPVSPYRSAFKATDGATFTVHANGKSYDCKLFCCRKKKVPVKLEENGEAEFQHIWGFTKNVNIFEYNRSVPYGFDSENEKVLIICPASDDVFVQLGKQKRSLDNGDCVWGYTVYTATAFLNHLSRSL